MNSRLVSFKRHTSLCLEGYIFQLKSNVWCDEYMRDGVQSFKISYTHLREGVVSTYVYHINSNAVCCLVNSKVWYLWWKECL